MGSDVGFDECKMSRRGESIGVYVTNQEVIRGSMWGSVSARYFLLRGLSSVRVCNVGMEV